MARVCMRQGCEIEATARVGFDSQNLRVVIDAHPDDPRGSAVLCDRHAASIKAPRGWTIDDLREPTPPLFREGVAVLHDAARQSRTTRPRRSRQQRPPAASHGTEQLVGHEFDSPAVRNTAIVPENERRGDADEPRASVGDNTPPLLSPSSPLLTRAFAKSLVERQSTGLASLLGDAGVAAS